MRIKNWKRFQHFRDRRPIWIKLYRDILDDLEWHELDPSSAKMLVMFWLVASEDEGRLPSVKELAFRLRSTEKQIESTVSRLSHYLEQDDINSISDGYQNDALEKRREEKEKEKKEALLSPDGDPAQNGFSPNDMVKIWNDKIKVHEKTFDNELDLPMVLKLTPDRKKQCLTRIKSLSLNEGKWSDVMEGILRSKFLVGVNDRGWVATFDWIVRNDKNIMRVVEGW